MEEKNTYFETSSETVPKSDDTQYCNKNVATPKATNFNYQPEVCTNLRGIDSIFATDNVFFFF